ncbi:MAG TPA: hypothetical protein VGJ94_19335 [Syntrophorhabdaceae bacterium]
MDIEDLKESHVCLTEKALPEKDVSTFIERLKEREPYSMDLINHRVALEPDEALEMLHKEDEVLKRLKEERAKVLKEMEKLSKSRKGARTYGSQFPFPPMPVFFDKTK